VCSHGFCALAELLVQCGEHMLLYRDDSIKRFVFVRLP